MKTPLAIFWAWLCFTVPSHAGLIVTYRGIADFAFADGSSMDGIRFVAQMEFDPSRPDLCCDPSAPYVRIFFPNMGRSIDSEPELSTPRITFDPDGKWTAVLIEGEINADLQFLAFSGGRSWASWEYWEEDAERMGSISGYSDQVPDDGGIFAVAIFALTPILRWSRFRRRH